MFTLMGIQGLLDHVKKTNFNLRQLQNKRFVIDGHTLLHKFAYACADDYVMNGNYTVIVRNILTFVKDFLNISPLVILIFDGGFLPAKAMTNETRQRQRDEAKIKAQNARLTGDYEQARKLTHQAIGFSRDTVISIAEAIIEQLCNFNNFYCFLSPYEADSQLVKLQKDGIVDIIVTIDSDLLLYNPVAVLFKYEITTKTGDLVLREDIFAVTFQNVSPHQLRRTAVLSGCDYVESIKGVGLIVALKNQRQHQNIIQTAQSLLEAGKQNPYSAAEEYYQKALGALYTLNYARVFDIQTSSMTSLNRIDKDVLIVPFFEALVGQQLDSQEALNICCPTKQMRKYVEKLKEMNKFVSTIPECENLVDAESLTVKNECLLADNIMVCKQIQEKTVIQNDSNDKPWFFSIMQTQYRE